MYPGTSKGQSIHINPFFKEKVLQKIRNNPEELPHQVIPSNAHINPLFVSSNVAATKTTIHMNPEFLNAKLKQQNADPNEHAVSNEEAVQQLPKITQLNKIISKSRTRIVRESHTKPLCNINVSPAKATSPILLLTKRKLVRATSNPLTNKPTVHKEILKRKLKYKLINKVHTLERTSFISKRRPKDFVGRYALRRVNSANAALTTFATFRAKQNGSTTGTTTTRSLNTRLRFININGILYKSLKNKLQRRVENPSSSILGSKLPNATNQSAIRTPEIASRSSKDNKGRTVYVRGAKFILDPKGFKLTRVKQAGTINVNAQNLTSCKKLNKQTSTVRTQSRRIDIGGLTYIASKQSNNVYVRTSTHLALAHLNQAKQRSVSVLSRCLRKVNKPCVIFQRIGKCAAFERNRCSKIHDRQHIIICPKFLKGLCTNADCLLSHNITLQKMPVCKFFLQGSCVRTDCPYLHKKLSESSEICENFRRGFCALAEQCNKQHVFSGFKPKLEATQLCQNQRLLDDSCMPIEEENAIASRYFSGENFVLGMDIDNDKDMKDCAEKTEKEIDEISNTVCNDSDNEDDSISTSENATKRKPLGTLPSFIPLS